MSRPRTVRLPVVAFAPLALLAACTDATAPQRDAVAPARRPAASLSDAASGGQPGFYLLPPLVPTAPNQFAGTFDPAVPVTARICTPLPGCETSVATFAVGGAGATAITVQAPREWYAAAWAAPASLPTGTGRYRLEVTAGAVRLGYVDLAVVETDKALRTVPAGYAGVVRGSTLPIRFRIETGIVGSVEVTPASASINLGATQGFTTTVRDLHGRTIASPAVSWTSDAAVATLSAAGGASTTATGVAAGSTAVTATSGGASGSATLTVVPLLGITSVSPSPMVPGAPATINGYQFSPTAANDTVRIGGVLATVTSATATSLQVVVPCIASGPQDVRVTVGADQTPAFSHPLQGNQRTLAVGQSVVVTSAAQASCNELPATGQASRYLVAVFSASTNPNSNSPFQLLGNGQSPAAPQSVAAQQSVASRESTAAQQSMVMNTGLVAPPTSPAAAQQQLADDRHSQIQERNAREFERLSSRFRGDRRMRASRSMSSAADPAVASPPLTRLFRVANLNASSICASYYVVSATRVYSDGKLAIYEDDATPDAFKAANNPTMAGNYTKIGDQYNADMEPIIRANFGDPLRRDATTDNNGALVALFTPRINNSFSGVAGFVVSCDQFPNDDASSAPAVGGPYTTSGGSNGASNFGEVFYAYQPVVPGTGYSGNTADNWYRTIRSTFIHETKHVASMAARVANDAPTYEASWLEEGTARHAEELWMRNAVDNQPWKSNIGYGSATNPINIYCDVRPSGSPECDANSRRPANIMQRHFGSLYTELFESNARLLSPFGRTISDNASYFYAISWSLVRYAADRYGASDAAFLTALTQSTTNGADNLAARAGVSVDELLGGWALALVADDHPALTASAPAIQMPTWNLRSIYAGLNADLSSTYLAPFPQVPTAYAFGAFTGPAVTTLRGGGVLWYELSGTQAEAQMLRLTGSGGGALPSTVRISIARLQ